MHNDTTLDAGWAGDATPSDGDHGRVIDDSGNYEGAVDQLMGQLS